MEEVPVQTAVAHSGEFAKKYASSLLVKIFAFVAMAYAGLNFYSLFMQLREKGFNTPYWFVNLIYIFGYVFICVGLFSIIGKNRDDGKVISELRAAGLGFGVLALVNIFYIALVFYVYYRYYYTNLYSIQSFLNMTGYTYDVFYNIAMVFSCIFAILLIRSIIGAIKGDPAGTVVAILTAVFSLVIIVPWIFFLVRVGGSITQDMVFTVTLCTRLLLAVLGCACALYWIPFARKTNDHIFMNEPEETQETDNDAAEPEHSEGGDNADVQPEQEDGAGEIQEDTTPEEPIEEIKDETEQ